MLRWIIRIGITDLQDEWRKLATFVDEPVYKRVWRGLYSNILVRIKLLKLKLEQTKKRNE